MVALSAFVADGCSEGGSGAPTTEELVARERAAAYFGNNKLDEARQALAPLLTRSRPRAEDLVRAAAIELLASQFEAARSFAERAIQAEPENAEAHYVLARVFDKDFAGIEQAIAEYRRVLELRPDDLPARACLAGALEQNGQTEEARALFQEIADMGVDNAGPYCVMAIYRLYTLATQEKKDKEAEELFARYMVLDKAGWKSPTVEDLDAGNLGRVQPPQPVGTGSPAAGSIPTFALETTILPELGGARALEAHDFDGNRELDLVATGDFGLRVALRDPYDIDPSREHFVETLVPAEPAAFEAFDLGNDDDLDVAAANGATIVVYEAIGRKDDPDKMARTVFEPAGFAIAALPAAPSEILAADYDHDGDLDLVCCGAFGWRILRCDGANPIPPLGQEPAIDARFQGGFADATAETGLSLLGPFTWVLSEDYDSDQDVDFLLGGPGPCVLASSLRSGRFEDRAAHDFGAPPTLQREPLAADLDGDARPDLFVPGETSRLWMRTPEERYQERPSAHAIPASSGPLFGVDLDLSGDLDLVWRGESDLAGVVLSLSGKHERAGRIAGTAGSGPIAVCDYDRNRQFDILRAAAGGVEVWRCSSPVGNGSLQQWFGLKDNKQGVGAIVEIRAGKIYRRIYWRGEPELIGVGEEPLIDVVHITWPNGIGQWKVDWDLGTQIDINETRQPAGQNNSCPFLYAWNGTTYGFVSDVLGITPLGLPMAPGLLVPPDHDEYVLVRGDQLVPKDGFLELQFTEELREVTYLDQIRIHAVDHPAGTEIYPNERFSFPPYPAPHTHTVRDPLPPARAAGSDGKDWTEELARVDDRHAVPFVPIAQQHLGLANPHWLELEFDREAVASAQKLRLICTGWLYWTDASVNLASARTPHLRFVPPTIELPKDGAWVPAGPPVGFPAGTTKTMVVDVTDILSREDPRLRLASTLRLYWDSIRLAVDGDDAELSVQELDPASAELWRRGFSGPEHASDEQPERFAWERLAERPRWNQHPGTYTRYGGCVPLLAAIDDCFVVLGAGDALTVRFDARALAPPPEGFVRDWLVFLDGWAKDRDPNTLQALEVEPYPFHAMSGYPYGEDEHFPDDELHRRWRAEWQTRPAHRWIDPISPARIAEEAAGARTIEASFGR